MHMHCKLLLPCSWCTCFSHPPGLGSHHWIFSLAVTPPCHDLWNEVATGVYSPLRSSPGRAHSWQPALPTLGSAQLLGIREKQTLIGTVLKFQAYKWSQASFCTAPEHKPFTTQIRIFCLLQPLESFCSCTPWRSHHRLQSIR